MKKNKNYLHAGLLIFGFPTILMINLLFWETSNSFFSIMMISYWVVQIMGAITLGQYLSRPKPNYSWEEIKEKRIFQIVSFVDETFNKESAEVESKHHGFIVVSIENFGVALVDFPYDLKIWGNNKPKIGQKYVRVKENLIYMIVDYKLNSL